jgi:hypothetical protein
VYGQTMAAVKEESVVQATGPIEVHRVALKDRYKQTRSNQYTGTSAHSDRNTSRASAASQEPPVKVEAGRVPNVNRRTTIDGRVENLREAITVYQQHEPSVQNWEALLPMTYSFLDEWFTVIDGVTEMLIGKNSTDLPPVDIRVISELRSRTKTVIDETALGVWISLVQAEQSFFQEDKTGKGKEFFDVVKTSTVTLPEFPGIPSAGQVTLFRALKVLDQLGFGLVLYPYHLQNSSAG